ncbi:MAG TPA: PQQ-dependent sugar dehydrogenase [Micromonosporaceae bacterium]|nr:PQQ-dependent sugar dehydrogenase [Micromonosporaceae bacterium]
MSRFNGSTPGRRWLALATGVLMVASVSAVGYVRSPRAAAAVDAPVADPITAKPTPATLGLVLDEFATFPKSEPTPAATDQRLMRHARINFLGEVPDGSGRIYVPDLNGKLYLTRAGGTPQEYLDVAAAFAPDFWSGRGLGSGFGFVTFHPEFAQNGTFYTVHSEAAAALTTKTPDLTNQPNAVVQSVVTEWVAADPAADTFRGTRREVLRLGFATYIHAIQQIEFNPTARPGASDYGLLYVAVGDGGIGVESNVPQDLAVPQGKILRIDPRGTNGTSGRYGIPPGNPFVGRAGALGEIYAYGMRDPHRFSWDPAGRNRMYLGHIGEHALESVYEVRAGDNLGWSDREGPYEFRRPDICHVYPLPADDAQRGYTYPVAAYDHDPPPGWPCQFDSGHAISGGFVYRGSNVPALRGKYVFGDLVDGRVFYTNERDMRRGRPMARLYELKIFDRTGTRVTMPHLAGDARVDLRFGTDRAGELYLLSKANGKVWKVTGTRTVAANPDVLPSLAPNLVASYDFEHAFVPQPSLELDQGRSGTNLRLVNGGAAMRVKDGAYPGSNTSIQTRQVSPTVAGNDDWKAGVYAATGVPSLSAFNNVSGMTVMGWFKMTGPHPAPNSNTADPNDSYDAVGLAGVLSGNSDGHAVRALIELIQVDGQLRLAALGRRLDGQPSQIFAASGDWGTLLPTGTWVFLAATFDFNRGTIALYRNGQPVDGSYLSADDPWAVAGEGPHATSPTDPRGIKIGGSFPQDSREQNPCDCRMDSLMFLDRAVTATEVDQQYRVAG